MNIFISWSGKQSQAVAKSLHDWIASVIPGTKPWLSVLDIPAGGRWFEDVMVQLETTDFCVICLTPDNMRSPWLYFEAGAIAARHKDAKVCGFLTGVNASQVSGPIAQFQCVQSDSDGVWSLVKEINRGLKGTTHNEALLQASFAQQWPRLREKLREALLLYDPRATPSEVETDQPKPKYKLSDEGRQLLAEAILDKNGTIAVVRTMSGLEVQTNGREMIEGYDPRVEAKWQGTIRELVRFGLIEDRGHKGEVFGVTAEGYRVADELKSKQTSSV